jgi:phage terminase large subunit-like protein
LYREAERVGELTITAAPGEDLDELLRLLAEVPNLSGIGVDPIGLEELVTRLQERGVEAVGIPQGFRLSPHLEAAERAYYAGKIRHADHPLLAWCVRNMRLKDRGGAKAVVKPSGESMGPDKIDLGICLVMAMATVSAAPPAWNVDAVIG